MPERVNIRRITVGHVHAEPADPKKVAEMHQWLIDHPDSDLSPLDVTPRDDGTLRIFDGRHRFVAYVLAGREHVPVNELRAERDQLKEELGQYQMGAVPAEELGRMREQRDANADAYMELTHRWAAARKGWEEHRVKLKTQLSSLLEAIDRHRMWLETGEPDVRVSDLYDVADGITEGLEDD